MKNGFLNDFKSFALKGNVIDMAVGVIIGGAFGQIVSSLVADIIMPPLGILLGGVNFKELAVELKPAVVENGEETAAAVMLNYGTFLQNVVDFLIIALSIFILIKLISKLSFKKAEEEKAAPPPPPPADIVLLTEIRDLLKEKNASAEKNGDKP